MGRWTYAERRGQKETGIMYDDGGQLSCLSICLSPFLPLLFIRRFGIHGGPRVYYHYFKHNQCTKYTEEHLFFFSLTLSARYRATMRKVQL